MSTTIEELELILAGTQSVITHLGPTHSGEGFSCMIQPKRSNTKWREPWTIRGRGDTLEEAVTDALARLSAMEMGRDDLKYRG